MSVNNRLDVFVEEPDIPETNPSSADSFIFFFLFLKIVICTLHT